MDFTLQKQANKLDLALVEAEFPRSDDVIYLNFGSCGRKPTSVLNALTEGFKALNYNPTLFTFLDQKPWQQARNAAARLLEVEAKQLLITQNSTQGLHLAMQSFLKNQGDELVTTNHEHGSLNAVARHLEETKGVVVRRHQVEPASGSEALRQGILALVNEKTKLVVVSEIFSHTGWRPDLAPLLVELERLEVPILLDGAHTPGQWQAETPIGRYQLWAASGHKWLGAPNGTGFLYVVPHLVPELEPVWVGDRYFETRDADKNDITRFEWPGSSDVVRLLGLAAACDLQLRLGPDKVAQRQQYLRRYLQSLLEPLQPTFRLPESIPEGERTAALVFYFPPQRLKVDDLRQALWQDHRIWVQPDLIAQSPGRGMRISCHFSVTESDLESLIMALKTMLV